MKDTEQYARAKRIFIRLMICVMALCTGFYLRAITAKPQVTYEKCSPVAKKTETVLMIQTVETAEETVTDTEDNTFSSLLWNTAQNGIDFMDQLTDTFIQSDLAQQMFTDEQLQQLDSLSDLATDLFDTLIGQNQP